MIVTGIAVRDVAADGAAVAYLRVGNLTRGLDQQGAVLGQQRRPDEVVLAGHGADADLVALEADALEGADAIQIDQVRGIGKTQLHHGQQAVSARQQLRFTAMGGQQRQRRFD